MIYSYNELKGKLKVGMKVRAVPGKHNGCDILNNKITGNITKVTDSLFEIDDCWHLYDRNYFLEIIDEQRSNEITKENLQVGDVIVDNKGYKARVLTISEEIFAISAWAGYDLFGRWATFQNARNYGWKIDLPPTPREVTMEEVEKAMGGKVVIKG